MDWASASDASLVVAIGRWHDTALAEAYRRHGGTVHALARRVLNSESRADEVTQDVFVDLWRRPERFDPDRGSLRSLLVTMAHSRAIDLLRSESARSAREERSARQANAGYDLENEVWDLTVAEHLQKAIATLPATERLPIEMSYFGGHTYREVASLLGEAEGTIKSRIRSGLKRLRSALAEQGVEQSWAE